MSEPTNSSSSSLAEEPEQKQTNDKTQAATSTTKATTGNANDKRQAFGSAKTENLSDTGLWRILLPTAVVIFCLVLFIIPLVILIPLLTNSLTGSGQETQLTWVWITMIVLEVIIAFVVARGILRIFLTQAGNYHA